METLIGTITSIDPQTGAQMFEAGPVAVGLVVDANAVARPARGETVQLTRADERSPWQCAGRGVAGTPEEAQWADEEEFANFLPGDSNPVEMNGATPAPVEAEPENL